jgi:DNA-binding NtrC family response regulator
MSRETGIDTIFVGRSVKPKKRTLKKSRLVVLSGPSEGRELLIGKERITIGRSSICDLVLDDPAVSSTHCELEMSEHGVVLRDPDSTNGTFLGEVQIREAWLQPEMVLRVGKSRIRFESAEGHVEIEVSKRDHFHELLGRGQRMREIFAVLEKVATSDLTVLVRGETGTGKELVARAIHAGSPRRQGPLVVQDCSAIPSTLIEDTLFGHERGAFTGATERRRGSFEQADGGTIVLDEIGELDLNLQPKLLRVLESREVTRVGGTKSVPVNVRVVAATNRDLRQMVADGTFREDLYYRLSVVQIELPPLRERPEDVPSLVREFLDAYAHRRYPEKNVRIEVAEEAMRRLMTYPWPGNVRELKNTVERAASLGDGQQLTVRDLLPESQKTPPEVLPGGTADQFVTEGLSFKEAKQRVLDAFEAAYLKVLLEKHGGNVTRAAEEAGLTRYHFRELAKRYGLRGRG